jgi:hypothetical protein
MMRIPINVLRSLAIVVTCSACVDAQSALRITYPLPGTIIAPGETTQLNVLTDIPLKALAIIGQDSIGGIGMLQAPPYQFELTIPTKTRPGEYVITARGVTASGQNVYGKVTIDVERRDSPKVLKVTDSELNFLTGESLPLAVYGTYADGAIVDLNKSAQTRYELASAGVVTVTADGWVKAIAPGSTAITVRHGEHAVVVKVSVRPDMIIRPAQWTLTASMVFQFVPNVRDLVGQRFTYQISPAVGKIDQDGKYTAPDSIDVAQTVSLVATSVNYPNLSAVATVTLSPAAGVEVWPKWAWLLPGQTQQFSSRAVNVGGSSVRWSVTPPGLGTITDKGLYTAPETIEKLQKVTITASSAARPSASQGVEIYMTAKPFTLFLPKKTASLVPGETKSITVVDLATDRFAHPLALSIGDLPTGIIAKFGKQTLIGNQMTDLTFSANANAVPGTYVVTVSELDTVYKRMSSSQSLTLVIADR